MFLNTVEKALSTIEISNGMYVWKEGYRKAVLEKENLTTENAEIFFEIVNTTDYVGSGYMQVEKASLEVTVLLKKDRPTTVCFLYGDTAEKFLLEVLNN